MSKFSNFKIKWPKSVEKLENGDRLAPLRQDLPPKNGPLDPQEQGTFIFGEVPELSPTPYSHGRTGHPVGVHFVPHFPFFIPWFYNGLRRPTGPYPNQTEPKSM